mmetsp:Transcript_58551/g.164207  ORF Transcript_58551/g.164207 Transcript_58551/m.164207 type:complete len:343 (+) Transcript_58551:629-1657(+)
MCLHIWSFAAVADNKNFFDFASCSSPKLAERSCCALLMAFSSFSSKESSTKKTQASIIVAKIFESVVSFHLRIAFFASSAEEACIPSITFSNSAIFSALSRSNLLSSRPSFHSSRTCSTNLALSSMICFRIIPLVHRNCFIFQADSLFSSSCTRSLKSSSILASIADCCASRDQTWKTACRNTRSLRSAKPITSGMRFDASDLPLRVSWSVAWASRFCAATQSCCPRTRLPIFACASLPKLLTCCPIEETCVPACTMATLSKCCDTPVASASSNACATASTWPSSSASRSRVAVETSNCSLRKKWWNSSLLCVGILPTKVPICSPSSNIASPCSSSGVSSTP